jgi:ABC-type methionine transport system ATPase subunit
MPDETTRRYWLTFEGGTQSQPCLWRMSRQFPNVQFDIRQASLQSDFGIMCVHFTGPTEDLDSALASLKDQGVKVDAVQEGN